MPAEPQYLDRFRTWQARSRNLLLLLGSAIFILMIAIALPNLPDLDDGIDYAPLIIAATTLAPATVLLSGAEFSATAALVGQRISLRDSAQIAVLSSAANLLPLPGSVLVRSNELRAKGANLRRAFGSPIAVGLLWVATASLLAGVWLVTSEGSGFGVLLTTGGAAAGGVAVALLRGVTGEWNWPAIVKVIALEAAMVGVSAGRYYLVLAALGVSADAGQALALALSSVIATAVGLIPGGLGLREALAGAFAPLVALPAAAGILAAAINRIIGLIALSAIAAILFARTASGNDARGAK